MIFSWQTQRCYLNFFGIYWYDWREFITVICYYYFIMICMLFIILLEVMVAIFLCDILAGNCDWSLTSLRDINVHMYSVLRYCMLQTIYMFYFLIMKPSFFIHWNMNNPGFYKLVTTSPRIVEELKQYETTRNHWAIMTPKYVQKLKLVSYKSREEKV